MKNIFRRTLTLCLIAFALVGVFAISASAAGFASSSTMVMVDPNTKKTASTFYLYGRADYICLKMNNDRSDQGADRPTFELYSDSAYKNKIASYQSGDPSEKTAYITLSLDLSNIKSGTYYAKTYIKKDNYSGFSIDKSTIKTYKIVIKKAGTTLTDMNTVMYGYENTENGPKIYWFGVPDATGYYVYRRNPDTKKYEKIKTVKDNGKKFVSYTDASREGVTSTDYYKVVAYKGSKKTPSSLKSLKATVLKTPTITIEPVPWKSISIKWSKVKSGAVYTVLRRTKNSDWEEISTTKSTGITMSFDDGVTESNDVYYFTVIANVNGVYSGYNTKGKAFRYLETPELKPCTYPDEGGITVNWDLVKGADQYAIYKKSGKNWTEIALVDGTQTSYTDTTVQSSEGATYTVCSMANGAYKYYKISGVKGIRFEKLILNEVVETDGQLQLSWTNPLSDQSCSYRIYYTQDGGELMEYKTVSETNCLFTPTRDIITYEFNVCSVKNETYGPLNEPGIIYNYFPKMYLPTVFCDSSGATIKWNGFAKAEGYVLYKKTADGEYEVLTETTENSFFDADITSDVAYAYKVAYKYDDVVRLDKVSDELNVTFVDEFVEIADELHEISYNGKGYLVSVDPDETEDCKYHLYRKVDGVWKSVTTEYYINEDKYYVKGYDSNPEYAFRKVYPDGRMTRLPVDGFTVYSAGCGEDVSVEKNKNVVTFSWDVETIKADKIFIYKNSKLLQEVDVSAGSFVDSEAVGNRYNKYKIVTQKDNFVALKGVSETYTYLAEPTYKVKENSSGIRISWDSLEIPCECVIYKKKADGSGWQKLKTCPVSDGGYTDKKVESGELNTYTVKLLDSDGNYSPYDKNGKSAMYLDAPEITKIKRNAKSVTFTWSKVPAAKSYTVKFKNDGKWVYVKDIPASTTTYTDKTIVSGTKQYYYVCACNGEYQSGYDDRKIFFVAQPEITKVTSTSKSIRIEFEKVKGATDYYIYIKEGNSTKWRELTNTKNNYYVHNVQPGTKYQYTVAAVWRRGGGYKTVSKYNTTGKAAKALSTPTLDEVISKKSGIIFSWNKVSGATGYNVYRKTSDSSWEKIAYVKGGDVLSYVDKTAKKGKTYTYTVRAKYSDCVSGCNKKGLTCKDKY